MASEFPRTHLKISDLPCADKSDSCYKTLLEYFWTDKSFLTGLTNLQDQNSRPFKADYNITYNEHSKLHLHYTRAKVTVIFIHGLWGDEKQFESVGKPHFEAGANLIYLTLPGHGKSTEKNLIHATYQGWIDSVDETVKLASLLGENAVLVGQSTGGLLAVYSALQYPSQVSGIGLLEPALEVNKRLGHLACYGQNFVEDARSLRFLNLLVPNFKIPSRSISIKMGCEVVKLTALLKQKFGGPECATKARHECWENLGSKIRVPSFVLNNVQDGIIEASAVSSFSRGLRNNQYTEINCDEESPHGQATYSYSTRINHLLSHMFFKSIRGVLDSWKLADSWRSDLMDNFSPKPYSYSNAAEFKMKHPAHARYLEILLLQETNANFYELDLLESLLGEDTFQRYKKITMEHNISYNKAIRLLKQEGYDKAIEQILNSEKHRTMLIELSNTIRTELALH